MKYITTKDLVGWTGRDAQDTMPEVIKRLIRYSSDKIESIYFPSGDDVSTDGFDGELTLSEKAEFLPNGKSVFEIKTGSGIRQKADDDYEKRKQNPLVSDPSEYTFIFVTPQLFKGSKKWAEEKRKENFWKDVQVINAIKLQDWLDQSPSVAAWLASTYLNILPAEGIYSPDEFWNTWSSNPETKTTLNSDLMIAGRNAQKNKLFELIDQGKIVSIQGSTEDEAIAFIICCFLNDVNRKNDFDSRCIIVDNESALRKLSLFKSKLIIIAKVENDEALNLAVSKGHTVIVPMSPAMSQNWANLITLPVPRRDEFIQAMMASGFPKPEAEKYSMESARNISILRRRLKIQRAVPEWAKSEKVRDIIPALLVGRWSEDFENDRRMVAKIAGMTYEEYSHKLVRLLNISDSPLIRIGSAWRLSSPMDAWLYAAKYITPNDFISFRECFLETLGEINPYFELEVDKRFMASYYKKVSQYSSWVKTGMIQSSILISLYGSEFQLSFSTSSEKWIHELINELLKSDNRDFWKSIVDNLPLIAEASPDSFLDSLERQFLKDSNPIIALMDEEKGFLVSTNYLSGLLWALENVCWLPEHLSRASVLLTKIAKLEKLYPSNTSNTAFNSLREIFKPWHYQTHAPFQERVEILNLIYKTDKEIGWNLLLALLPNFSDVARGSHKMRWRISSGYDLLRTRKEMFDMHSAIVDILISSENHLEENLAELISISSRLKYSNYEIERLKIVKYVNDSFPNVIQINYNIWEELRDILHSNLAFPKKQRIFTKNELEPYQKLYNQFEPSDEFEKISWLFKDEWPKFPYYTGDDRNEKYEFINSKRVEALKPLYEKYGLQKMIDFAMNAGNPSSIGHTLAMIQLSKEDEVSIYECLKFDDNRRRFIYGYIFKLSLINGVTHIIDVFEKIKNIHDPISLYNLFIPLNGNSDLWDFIDQQNVEFKKAYWSNVNPHFYNLSTAEKIRGLNCLLEVKRPYAAMDIARHYKDEINTETILRILEIGAMEGLEEDLRDTYRIEQLFTEIDSREDVNITLLAKLEWYYLSLLPGYGRHRSPKVLHQELTNSPEFFVEILKMFYRPESDELAESETKNLSFAELKRRAEKVYQLFESWKSIPGVNEEGIINEEILWSWIHRSRELAEACGRGKVVDYPIGQLLAQYPENGKNWPPDEICNIIDTINTEQIKSSFSTAIVNNRGMTSRGVTEGGTIEKELANYFNAIGTRIRNKYPVTAVIMFNLAERYLIDADDMDKEAQQNELEY